MIQKILALSSALFLLSCTSGPTENGRTMDSDRTFAIFENKTELTGNTFFVQRANPTPLDVPVDKAQMQTLEQFTKDFMKSKGFVEAANVRKAHVVVVLNTKMVAVPDLDPATLKSVKAWTAKSAEYNSHLLSDRVIPTSFTKILQKGAVVPVSDSSGRLKRAGYILVYGYVQSFGKRPASYFETGVVVDRQKAFKDPEWLERLEEKIKTLELKPNTTASAMKGDPGDSRLPMPEPMQAP